MSLIESLLIIAAFSINVLLVAEYEGANLRILEAKRLLLVIVIFFLCQMVSFGAGYWLTTLPLFQRSVSLELRLFCYALAAIILLGIGVWMLWHTGRREVIVERLRDLQPARILLEALVVALITFLSGIACGFLQLYLGASFLIVACATILAVVGGIYIGYYQGNRFRKPLFGVSGFVFLGMGVEILMRHVVL